MNRSIFPWLVSTEAAAADDDKGDFRIRSAHISRSRPSPLPAAAVYFDALTGDAVLCSAVLPGFCPVTVHLVSPFGTLPGAPRQEPSVSDPVVHN